MALFFLKFPVSLCRVYESKKGKELFILFQQTNHAHVRREPPCVETYFARSIKIYVS